VIQVPESGLGLAISSRIAKALGGKLSVNSKPGEGSSFELLLPLEGQKKASYPHKQIKDLHLPTSSSYTNLNVLIAEDAEISRLVIRRMLDKFEIQADIATDGEEAIQMAKQKQYQLILMDLRMPGIDGINAAAKILKDCRTNPPVIVAMTANLLAAHREACREAGMKDFLEKPVRWEDLQRIIEFYFPKIKVG
jgi:CheY-like chemotaxis protein